MKDVQRVTGALFLNRERKGQIKSNGERFDMMLAVGPEDEGHTITIGIEPSGGVHIVVDKARNTVLEWESDKEKRQLQFDIDTTAPADEGGDELATALGTKKRTRVSPDDLLRFATQMVGKWARVKRKRIDGNERLFYAVGVSAKNGDERRHFVELADGYSPGICLRNLKKALDDGVTVPE